ncbi:hypothetical protein [Actinoplanes sp. NBRC 103695]|uniref:hypothetical protein n=1 Tax=Actinoplanes sp. NBRC 103695 TaxID=3032202 RepID=UPI0024A2F691|nr:hypothetical protein [Actinoplanes sp. NBRC 103695]GLY97195.1 hypothetical protein Acsp02_44490 [Actinoplanes sp. NBRC 103695]
MVSATNILCLEGHFPAEFGDFLTADPRAAVPSSAYGVKAALYRGVRPVFMDLSAYGAFTVRDMLRRADPETVARMVVFVDQSMVVGRGAQGLQDLADLSGLDHFTLGLDPEMVKPLADAGGAQFVPVNNRLEPVEVDQATGVLVRPDRHLLSKYPVAGEEHPGAGFTTFKARKGQLRRTGDGVQIGLTPSTATNLGAGLTQPEQSPAPETGFAAAGYDDLLHWLDAMSVGDHATLYVTADADAAAVQYQVTMHDAGLAVWHVMNGEVVAATLPAEPAEVRVVLPVDLDQQRFRREFARLMGSNLGLGSASDDIGVNMMQFGRPDQRARQQVPLHERTPSWFHEQRRDLAQRRLEVLRGVEADLGLGSRGFRFDEVLGEIQEETRNLNLARDRTDAIRRTLNRTEDFTNAVNDLVNLDELRVRVERDQLALDEDYTNYQNSEVDNQRIVAGFLRAIADVSANSLFVQGGASAPILAHVSGDLANLRDINDQLTRLGQTQTEDEVARAEHNGWFREQRGAMAPARLSVLQPIANAMGVGRGGGFGDLVDGLRQAARGLRGRDRTFVDKTLSDGGQTFTSALTNLINLDESRTRPARQASAEEASRQGSRERRELAELETVRRFVQAARVVVSNVGVSQQMLQAVQVAGQHAQSLVDIIRRSSALTEIEESDRRSETVRDIKRRDIHAERQRLATQRRAVIRDVRQTLELPSGQVSSGHQLALVTLIRDTEKYWQEESGDESADLGSERVFGSSGGRPVGHFQRGFIEALNSAVYLNRQRLSHPYDYWDADGDASVADQDAYVQASAREHGDNRFVGDYLDRLSSAAAKVAEHHWADARWGEWRATLGRLAAEWSAATEPLNRLQQEDAVVNESSISSSTPRATSRRDPSRTAHSAVPRQPAPEAERARQAPTDPQVAPGGVNGDEYMVLGEYRDAIRRFGEANDLSREVPRPTRELISRSLTSLQPPRSFRKPSDVTGKDMEAVLFTAPEPFTYVDLHGQVVHRDLTNSWIMKGSKRTEKEIVRNPFLEWVYDYLNPGRRRELDLSVAVYAQAVFYGSSLPHRPHQENVDDGVLDLIAKLVNAAPGTWRFERDHNARSTSVVRMLEHVSTPASRRSGSGRTPAREEYAHGTRSEQQPVRLGSVSEQLQRIYQDQSLLSDRRMNGLDEILRLFELRVESLSTDHQIGLVAELRALESQKRRELRDDPNYTFRSAELAEAMPEFLGAYIRLNNLDNLRLLHLERRYWNEGGEARSQDPQRYREDRKRYLEYSGRERKDTNTVARFLGLAEQAFSGVASHADNRFFWVNLAAGVTSVKERMQEHAAKVKDLRRQEDEVFSDGQREGNGNVRLRRAVEQIKNDRLREIHGERRTLARERLDALERIQAALGNSIRLIEEPRAARDREAARLVNSEKRFQAAVRSLRFLDQQRSAYADHRHWNVSGRATRDEIAQYRDASQHESIDDMTIAARLAELIGAGRISTVPGNEYSYENLAAEWRRLTGRLHELQDDEDAANSDFRSSSDSGDSPARAQASQDQSVSPPQRSHSRQHPAFGQASPFAAGAEGEQHSENFDLYRDDRSGSGQAPIPERQPNPQARRSPAGAAAQPFQFTYYTPWRPLVAEHNRDYPDLRKFERDLANYQAGGLALPAPVITLAAIRDAFRIYLTRRTGASAPSASGFRHGAHLEPFLKYYGLHRDDWKVQTGGPSSISVTYSPDPKGLSAFLDALWSHLNFRDTAWPTNAPTLHAVAVNEGLRRLGFVTKTRASAADFKYVLRKIARIDPLGYSPVAATKRTYVTQWVPNDNRIETVLRDSQELYGRTYDDTQYDSYVEWRAAVRQYMTDRDWSRPVPEIPFDQLAAWRASNVFGSVAPPNQTPAEQLQDILRDARVPLSLYVIGTNNDGGEGVLLNPFMQWAQKYLRWKQWKADPTHPGEHIPLGVTNLPAPALDHSLVSAGMPVLYAVGLLPRLRDRWSPSTVNQGDLNAVAALVGDRAGDWRPIRSENTLTTGVEWLDASATASLSIHRVSFDDQHPAGVLQDLGLLPRADYSPVIPADFWDVFVRLETWALELGSEATGPEIRASLEALSGALQSARPTMSPVLRADPGSWGVNVLPMWDDLVREVGVAIESPSGDIDAVRSTFATLRNLHQSTMGRIRDAAETLEELRPAHQGTSSDGGRTGARATALPAGKAQLRQVPDGVQIGLTPSAVKGLAAGLTQPEQSPAPETGFVAGYDELVHWLGAMSIGDHATVYVTADADTAAVQYQATMHDSGLAVWHTVNGEAAAATLPAQPARVQVVLPSALDERRLRREFARLVGSSLGEGAASADVTVNMMQLPNLTPDLTPAEKAWNARKRLSAERQQVLERLKAGLAIRGSSIGLMQSIQDHPRYLTLRGRLPDSDDFFPPLERLEFLNRGRQSFGFGDPRLDGGRTFGFFASEAEQEVTAMTRMTRYLEDVQFVTSQLGGGNPLDGWTSFAVRIQQERGNLERLATEFEEVTRRERQAVASANPLQQRIGPVPSSRPLELRRGSAPTSQSSFAPAQGAAADAARRDLQTAYEDQRVLSRRRMDMFDSIRQVFEISGPWPSSDDEIRKIPFLEQLRGHEPDMEDNLEYLMTDFRNAFERLSRLDRDRAAIRDRQYWNHDGAASEEERAQYLKNSRKEEKDTKILISYLRAAEKGAAKVPGYAPELYAALWASRATRLAVLKQDMKWSLDRVRDLASRQNDIFRRADAQVAEMVNIRREIEKTYHRKMNRIYAERREYAQTRIALLDFLEPALKAEIPRRIAELAAEGNKDARLREVNQKQLNKSVDRLLFLDGQRVAHADYRYWEAGSDAPELNRYRTAQEHEPVDDVNVKNRLAQWVYGKVTYLEGRGEYTYDGWLEQWKDVTERLHKLQTEEEEAKSEYRGSSDSGSSHSSEPKVGLPRSTRGWEGSDEENQFRQLQPGLGGENQGAEDEYDSDNSMYANPRDEGLPRAERRRREAARELRYPQPQTRREIPAPSQPPFSLQPRQRGQQHSATPQHQPADQIPALAAGASTQPATHQATWRSLVPAGSRNYPELAKFEKELKDYQDVISASPPDASARAIQEFLALRPDIKASATKRLIYKDHGIPFLQHYGLHRRDWKIQWTADNRAFTLVYAPSPDGLSTFLDSVKSHRVMQDMGMNRAAHPPVDLTATMVNEALQIKGQKIAGGGRHPSTKDFDYVLREFAKIEPTAFSSVLTGKNVTAYRYNGKQIETARPSSEEIFGPTYKKYKTPAEWLAAMQVYKRNADWSVPAPEFPLEKLSDWVRRLPGHESIGEKPHDWVNFMLESHDLKGFFVWGKTTAGEEGILLNPILQFAQKYLRWKMWSVNPRDVRAYIPPNVTNLPMPVPSVGDVYAGLPFLHARGMIGQPSKSLKPGRITKEHVKAMSTLVGDKPHDWERVGHDYDASKTAQQNRKAMQEVALRIRRTDSALPPVNAGGTVPLTIHPAREAAQELPDGVLEDLGLRPSFSELLRSFGMSPSLEQEPHLTGGSPANFLDVMEFVRTLSFELPGDASLDDIRASFGVVSDAMEDASRVLRGIRGTEHENALLHWEDLMDAVREAAGTLSGEVDLATARSTFDILSSIHQATMTEIRDVATAIAFPVTGLPAGPSGRLVAPDGSVESLVREARQDPAVLNISTADHVAQIKEAFKRSTDERLQPLDHAVRGALGWLPDGVKAEISTQWNDLQADAAGLTDTAPEERVEAVLRRYTELSVQLRELAGTHGQEAVLPRPVFLMGGLAEQAALVHAQVQHKISDARTLSEALKALLNDPLFRSPVRRAVAFADYRQMQHELHKLEDFSKELRELYHAPGMELSAGSQLLKASMRRLERFTQNSTEIVGRAQARIEQRAARTVAATRDNELRKQLTLWMNIVNSAGSATSVGLLPTGFSWAPATITFATDLARVTALRAVEHAQTKKIQADQSNDQIYATHDRDPLLVAQAQAQVLKDGFKLMLEAVEIGANVWPAWPVLQGTINMMFDNVVDKRIELARQQLEGKDRPTAVQALEGMWATFLKDAKEKFSDAGAWKTITEAIKGSATPYGVTGSFASLVAKPLVNLMLDIMPLRPVAVVTGRDLRERVDALGSLSTEDTTRPQPTVAAEAFRSDPFPQDMPRRDAFGRATVAYRNAGSDGQLFSAALNFYGSHVWGKLDRKGIFSPEHVDLDSYVDEATVQRRVIGKTSYTEDGVEVRGTWHQPFKSPRMGQPRNDYLFVRDSDGGWEWYHEMSVPGNGRTGRDNIHNIFAAHPGWITEGDFAWNPPTNGKLVIPFVDDRPQLGQQVHQLAAWTAHQVLEGLGGAQTTRPHWSVEAGAIGDRLNAQLDDWAKRVLPDRLSGRLKTGNSAADEASIHRAGVLRDEVFRLIDRHLDQQAAERGIDAKALPSVHDLLADPIGRGPGLDGSRADEDLIEAAKATVSQRFGADASLRGASDLGLIWVENLKATAHARPQWLDRAEQHLAPVGAPPTTVTHRAVLTSQVRDTAQTVATQAVSEAWQFRMAGSTLTDAELVQRIKAALRPSTDESADPNLDRLVSDVLESLPDSADKTALTAAWNGAKEDAESLAPGTASIRAVLNSYAHAYAWLDEVARSAKVTNPLPRPLAVVAGLADSLAVAWAQVERKLQDARFLAEGMHDFPSNALLRDHPKDLARAHLTLRLMVHHQHNLEDYTEKLRPLFSLTAEGVADAEEVLGKFPAEMEDFTTKSTSLSREVQRVIATLATRSAVAATETPLKARVGLSMNVLNSGFSAMSMALAPTGWGWAPATTTFLADLARTAVMRAVEHADAKRQEGDKSAAAIFAAHDDDPLTVATAQYETAKTLFRLTLEAIEIGAHVFPGWPLISGIAGPAFNELLDGRLNEAKRLAGGADKSTFAQALTTGLKGAIEEAKSNGTNAGVWKTIVEGSKGAATPYGWAGAFAGQVLRPLIDAVLEMLPIKPATPVTGRQLMALVEQMDKLSPAGTVAPQPTSAPAVAAEAIPARLAGKFDRFGRPVREYKSDASDQRADRVALDIDGAMVWGTLDRQWKFTPESFDPSARVDEATLRNRVLTKNSYIEAGGVEVFGKWYLPFHSADKPQFDYLFIRDSDGGKELFPAFGLVGGETSSSTVHRILGDPKHDWVSEKADTFQWDPPARGDSMVLFGPANEPTLDHRTHSVISYFAFQAIRKQQINQGAKNPQKMPQLHVEAGALGSRLAGQFNEWAKQLDWSPVDNPQARADSQERAANLHAQVVRLVDRRLRMHAATLGVPLKDVPKAADLVAQPISRGEGLLQSKAPEELQAEAREATTHSHRQSSSLTDSSDFGFLWTENLDVTVAERPQWFSTTLAKLARLDTNSPNVLVIEPKATQGAAPQNADLQRQARFVEAVKTAAAAHSDQAFIAVNRAGRDLGRQSIRRVVRTLHMFASSQDLLPQADRRVPVLVIDGGLDMRLRKALNDAGLHVPIMHRVTVGISESWRLTLSNDDKGSVDLSGIKLSPAAVGLTKNSSFQTVEQVPAELAPWLHAITSADREAAPEPDYTAENEQQVTRVADLMPEDRSLQLAKGAFTFAQANVKPELIRKIAAAGDQYDAGNIPIHEHPSIAIFGAAFTSIKTHDPDVGDLNVDQLNKVIAGSAVEYEPRSPEEDHAKFTQSLLTALDTLQKREHVGADLDNLINSFYKDNQTRMRNNLGLQKKMSATVANHIDANETISAATKLSMERLQQEIFRC